MRRAWLPLTAAVSLTAGLAAVTLTGKTIRRQRRLLEQASRSYEARITMLLDVLAKHSKVNIIRDADGETLQGRELDGPLVFLGAEHVMVSGCSFRTTGEPTSLTVTEGHQVPTRRAAGRSTL